MKKKNILSLISVFCLLLVIPMIYAECPASTPAGWSCSETTATCSGNSDAYTGQCSVKLALKNPDPYGNYYIEHPVNLEANNAYRVTFYAKSSDAQYVYVRLTDYRGWTAAPGAFQNYPAETSANHYVPFQAGRNLYPTWTKYTFETHIINENIINIQLFVGADSYGDGKSVLIDSFHIEKISSSSFPASEDYGFINPINHATGAGADYLCYDYQNSENTGISKWTWLGAGQNPFKITTIGTAYGTTDAISNSAQWFYCNATGNGELKGIEIKKNGTFENRFEEDKISCSDAFSLIYSREFIDLPASGANKCPDGTNNCCQQDKDNNGNWITRTVFRSSINSCADDCYFYDSEDPISSENFCNDYPQYCPHETIDESILDGTDLLEKTLCNFNLSGCLETDISDYYNPNRNCADQPDTINYNYEKCSDTSVCVDGMYIHTKDTDRCCFGEKTKAHCESNIPSIINTEINCTSAGGTPYNSKRYACYSDSKLIKNPVNIEMDRCCFGDIFESMPFLGEFTYLSPQAFICYAENGNNKIAECCYDGSCSNIYLVENDNERAVSSANGKVQSQGGALHTLWNFDKLRDTMLIDYVKKLTIPTSVQYQTLGIETNYIASDAYEFLEFDVAFNQEDILGLKVNGVDLGPLSKFLNNGKSTMRWHHAIIPISLLGENKRTINTITFYKLTSTSKSIKLLIDNIILMPPKNSAADSANYFCTGSFGSWISDLDPDVSNTSTDWDAWENYGPYKFACEAQGSYGWTGHQCCGDDTKLTNYGEHFNDTAAGCFNGSLMMNEWAVWQAKNLHENDKQEFESYIYKDLLYSNNQFIGCQVQDGKYDSLKSSRNGNSIESTNLVNSYENNQCKLQGSYYCMNNAWHKDILGYGDAATGMNISIKQAPPGSEIIINGNFGG